MVNARELYEFLGSKRQFANWIKERIESYDFEESIDFVVFHKDMKNSKGGRSGIEYAITVTMAKEFSERNFASADYVVFNNFVKNPKGGLISMTS